MGGEKQGIEREKVDGNGEKALEIIVSLRRHKHNYLASDSCLDLWLLIFRDAPCGCCSLPVLISAYGPMFCCCSRVCDKGSFPLPISIVAAPQKIRTRSRYRALTTLFPFFCCFLLQSLTIVTFNERKKEIQRNHYYDRCSIAA